jgi:hypothetical protein
VVFDVTAWTLVHMVYFYIVTHVYSHGLLVTHCLPTIGYESHQTCHLLALCMLSSHNSLHTIISNVNLLIALTLELNSNSYHDWKFNLMMILCCSCAWPVLSGALSRPIVSNESTALEDEFAALLEWERHLEEGLTTIRLSINQSQVPYIWNCTTGPKA